MPKLTASRLRALLSYEPGNGVFTWRVDGGGRYQRKGARAGTINGKGYRQVCIDRSIYLCARLAVPWMTGRWPRKLVDHRNCIKSDDRWDNLRDATHSQNGANSHARKGCKGVIRTRGKYEARIKVNYRNIYLGRFDSAERAHAVYAAAAEKHFGEFARRL